MADKVIIVWDLEMDTYKWRKDYGIQMTLVTDLVEATVYDDTVSDLPTLVTDTQGRIASNLTAMSGNPVSPPPKPF